MSRGQLHNRRNGALKIRHVVGELSGGFVLIYIQCQHHRPKRSSVRRRLPRRAANPVEEPSNVEPVPRRHAEEPLDVPTKRRTQLQPRCLCARHGNGKPSERAQLRQPKRHVIDAPALAGNRFAKLAERIQQVVDLVLKVKVARRIPYEALTVPEEPLPLSDVRREIPLPPAWF